MIKADAQRSGIHILSFLLDGLLLLPGAIWLCWTGWTEELREAPALLLVGGGILAHLGLKYGGMVRPGKMLLALNQGLSMLLLAILLLGLLTLLPQGQGMAVMGVLGLLTGLSVNLYLLQQDWNKLKGL